MILITKKSFYFFFWVSLLCTTTVCVDECSFSTLKTGFCVTYNTCPTCKSLMYKFGPQISLWPAGCSKNVSRNWIVWFKVALNNLDHPRSMFDTATLLKVKVLGHFQLFVDWLIFVFTFPSPPPIQWWF